MKNKEKILILNQNISGMNKYLFKYLKEDLELNIKDVGYSNIDLFFLKVKSMKFSLKKWRTNYYERILPSYLTSANAFIKRSMVAYKIASKSREKYDTIFLPCPMYGHGLDSLEIPYVIFVSFTLALSWKEWPPWAPFIDESTYKKRIQLERNLYKKCTKILTSNEHARKSLIYDYEVESSKVVNVGYGANIDFLPEPKSENYGNRRVLFIGKDFERKGGFVLLKAFQSVIKVLPDATLIIIGPLVNIPEIERRKNIRFLGYIKDRLKIYEEYQRASIFCMPSICEPFGLVFLEAMAHGLPCLATTADAMPEIIINEQTGLLVPPNDPDSLANAMIKMLTEVDKLAEMGKKAREFVIKNYLWKNTAKTIGRELIAST